MESTGELLNLDFDTPTSTTTTVTNSTPESSPRRRQRLSQAPGNTSQETTPLLGAQHTTTAPRTTTGTTPEPSAQQRKYPEAYYPRKFGASNLSGMRELTSTEYDQSAVDTLNQNTDRTRRHFQRLDNVSFDESTKRIALEIRGDFFQQLVTLKTDRLEKKINIHTPLWRKLIYGFGAGVLATAAGFGGYVAGAAATLGMDGGAFVGLAAGTAAAGLTFAGVYKTCTTLDTRRQHKNLDKEYKEELQALSDQFIDTCTKCGTYKFATCNRTVDLSSYPGLGYYLHGELDAINRRGLTLNFDPASTQCISPDELLSETDNAPLPSRQERTEQDTKRSFFGFGGGKK